MNISDLLVSQAILIQEDAQDSTAVLRKLGGILNELGYVTDGFIDATLRREADMPTGLPLAGQINAAIPHVDLEYVKKPAIALATLKEPVAFHHMIMTEEEVPVRLVIMLALDQPKSQIEVLQEVAGFLQKPEVVDSLMTAQTPKDVLDTFKQLEMPS